MFKKLTFISALLLSSIRAIDANAPKVSENVQTDEIFIESGNAKIFCRTMGKGKPLIVIHGGPGLSQDYLLPQLNRLAETHFVIFYDQRGQGRSTGEINPKTMNIESLVNDLDNIRKAFKFDKISILGHSWGGFLAMRYAIANSQSVDRLILSNSMPASSDELALFVNEWTRRIAPFQDKLSAMQNTKKFQAGDTKLHEQANQLIFRTYCHIPAHADALSLRMTPSASLNGAKIRALIWEKELSKPFNLHESLKTIHVPTLIVHGDDDVVPLITAQHTHKSIQDSKYVLLKDCGHFPYVEKPNAYFEAITDFLK